MSGNMIGHEGVMQKIRIMAWTLKSHFELGTCTAEIACLRTSPE